MPPEPPTFNFWTIAMAALVGAAGGAAWWHVMAFFSPSPMGISTLAASTLSAVNLVFAAIVIEVFFR